MEHRDIHITIDTISSIPKAAYEIQYFLITKDNVNADTFFGIENWNIIYITVINSQHKFKNNHNNINLCRQTLLC